MKAVGGRNNNQEGLGATAFFIDLGNDQILLQADFAALYMTVSS